MEVPGQVHQAKQHISELVFDATTTEGLVVHLENCNVYRFRDGKFAAVKVYGDSVEMKRQFGLST